MSDQTELLIQLIKEEKTCNEICNILNVSNKQLYNNLTNLRNKGLFFRRKYYSNGIILYKSIKGLHELKDYYNSAESNIITSNKEEEMKILVISDLHFGSSLERVDLIERAYNYCTKNNIHLIFCCGDMIDGAYGKYEKKIEDIYTQVDYFIKKYPFDKNILTFGVGGDHDYSALNKCGQNLLEIIKSYRHDIVVNSFNDAYVNIKNDKIQLHHHYKNCDFESLCPSIILHGHMHKYMAQINNKNILDITVPSLSDINSSFPTALELDLTFKKGYINFANLKQIYFGDKDYVFSEMNYDLLKNKDVQIVSIINEEAPMTENLTILQDNCLEAQKVLSKKN